MFLLPVQCDDCRTGPQTLTPGNALLKVWWMIAVSGILDKDCYFSVGSILLSAKAVSWTSFLTSKSETWVLSQWLLLFYFQRGKKKKEWKWFYLWCSHAPPLQCLPLAGTPFLVSGVIVTKGEKRETFTQFQTCGGKETMKHLRSEHSVLSHPSVSVFSPLPFFAVRHLWIHPLPAAALLQATSISHLVPCISPLTGLCTHPVPILNQIILKGTVTIFKALDWLPQLNELWCDSTF